MNAQQIVVRHITEKTEKDLRVTLTKNTKGYNWEVSYSGEDLDAVLSKIREADQGLRAEYEKE